LVAMAFRSLGTAFQAAPAPRDEASLVVGGIYRTLRHPMYTAVVGVVTGLFLLRPTWPMGVSAGALIVFYLIKARHEEGLLAQRYPEYEAYRQRSRGVIPFR
jgi:protein-S-isoprenylcysteine O-methyltransferase Ste14